MWLYCHLVVFFFYVGPFSLGPKKKKKSWKKNCVQVFYLKKKQ